MRQYHLGDVPAKEHITLPEPLFQRVQEVLGGHTLATIDALDIRSANLDILDLALVNQLFDVCHLHELYSSFLFVADDTQPSLLTDIFSPLISSGSAILQTWNLRAGLLDLCEVDICHDSGWGILRLGQHQSPGIHNH